MDLISVIVPIYNTREYLPRCLDSILMQTYSNLEIILIDDGSNDGTELLCDEYQRKYDNVRVIHKKNEGQAIGRNLGVDVSFGEYIAFVDSDDWIAPDMINTLYANIKKYKADISCCNNFNEKHVDTNEIKIFVHPEIMLEHIMNHQGTGHSPCDKLYRKNVFEGVRFPIMRAYEDCATIYRLFRNAQKIVYQDTTFYFYENRSNSTMTQSFSRIKFYAVQAYYQMYKDYAEWHPEYVYRVKKLLVGSIQYVIGETLVKKLKNEFRDEYEAVRKIANELSTKQLNFKMKVGLFLIKHFPAIYMLIYGKLKKQRIRHKDFYN